MFKPWPRLIKRITGPRLWVQVDRSQHRPAITIERVSSERYRSVIDYLARLSGLSPAEPNRYEARLLNQIADVMVDLAFLNRHGDPKEGMVRPRHWE